MIAFSNSGNRGVWEKKIASADTAAAQRIVQEILNFPLDKPAGDKVDDAHTGTRFGGYLEGIIGSSERMGHETLAQQESSPTQTVTNSVPLVEKMLELLHRVSSEDFSGLTEDDNEWKNLAIGAPNFVRVLAAEARNFQQDPKYPELANLFEDRAENLMQVATLFEDLAVAIGASRKPVSLGGVGGSL